MLHATGKQMTRSWLHNCTEQQLRDAYKYAANAAMAALTVDDFDWWERRALRVRDEMYSRGMAVQS